MNENPRRVPEVQSPSRSRFVNVGGIRTHYLEAGDGPTIVLLHSGEFGACAELSWEYLLPELSREYRVVAPDWLGFGLTDKLYDFAAKRQRMVDHMADFLRTLCIESADFVGNSMGATTLLAVAAEPDCPFPIRTLTAISGGGEIPDNLYRSDMLTFDGTRAAMVKVLQALFIDEVWHMDPEYVDRRLAIASLPGAWEAVAASRLRNPANQRETTAGDPIEYELIQAPTLLIAGELDHIRHSGYAETIARRIPNARAVTVEGVGHCPNIERPKQVAQYVMQFIASASTRQDLTQEGNA